MEENLEIEYQETVVRPIWGEKKVEVIYVMTHKKNDFVNQYRVVAEIAGIQSRDLHFGSVSAERIGTEDTNSETLTAEGAGNLFEVHT